MYLFIYLFLVLKTVICLQDHFICIVLYFDFKIHVINTLLLLLLLLLQNVRATFTLPKQELRKSIGRILSTKFCQVILL